MISRLWRYRTVLLLGFPLLLVGLYSLAGFVILPFVLQQTLTHSFAEHIQQTVEVGDIRINPYRLKVQVSGFRIIDKKKETLLGFEELFLDVEPFSLFTTENIIEQVRLQQPHITFAGDKKGHAELLNVLSRAQTFLTTEEDSKPTPMPAVWVQQLEITDGLLDFSQQQLDKHLQEKWHIDSISLKDFHTRDSTHANSLSVVLDDSHHGKLRLNSVVQLEPLSVSGDVAITGFDSTRFMAMLTLPYGLQLQALQMNAQAEFIATVSDELHFSLKKGSVDLQPIAIKQSKNDEAVLEIPAINVEGIAVSYPEQAVHIDSIKMHDLAINNTAGTDKENHSPTIFIPLLNILNIDIQAVEQQVKIASVVLQDGNSDVVLDKHGQLNLQTLAESIIGSEDAVATTTTATPAKPAQTVNKPWDVTIAAANIDNHRVHVRNEQLDTPLDVELFPVNLALQNVKPLDDNAVIPAQLTMVLVDKAADKPAVFNVAATITRETMSAEAKATLTQLPLKLMQPYVDEQATVDIKKGRLDANLDLRVSAKDKLAFNVTGNVDILDLNIHKKNSKKKLLAWEKLAIEKLHFNSTDNALHINTVTVNKSYGRFIINPDGTSNVQDLLIDTNAVTTAAVTAPTVNTQPIAELAVLTVAETAINTAVEAPDENMLVVEGEKPFQFDIDTVKITDGEMGFSDLSLSPHFRLVLKQLNGEIQQMSSNADIQAIVDLKGKVNRYAPANIAGTFNVLSEKPQLNMQVGFKNIDLTTFTPYSGVYAGYVINKGQISVDLHYRLVNEKIQGENRIIISQLTLGDKVKSDKIIDVPVKLAIALLQDENGLIDLGFKVNGDINDPQFDVGEIIYTAFKDTLKKAVSAPFKFFKNLFKRKERSIQNLVFDEGSDVINAATEEKLKVVAMILRKREMLQLNIQGNALPEKDIPSLQQQILLQTLEADSNIPESEFLPAANPASNPRVYQALADLYKMQQAKSISNLEEQYTRELLATATINTAENNPVANELKIKQLAYQQAWQELLEGMPVSADDIEDLAIERAREVKALLVEKYHIGAERIFVLSNHTDTSKQSLTTQLILDVR